MPCYNLPTATSNKIAAILPGDGDQVTAARDIVLYKHGGGLQEISDIHPLYPSLHYVLLFPNGDLGWHPEIFHMDVEDPGDDHQRKRVTQLEYFKYHLHPCQGESVHLFMAWKLFQEYAVDSWATTEQRHNQSQIKAETYQGLVDAVAVDPNVNAENVATCLILPSSFSGFQEHDPALSGCFGHQPSI